VQKNEISKIFRYDFLALTPRYINNTNVKYSQAKQDQTVYDLFPKKNGLFIEIGAFDGMTLSITLWLER
jgi:hypothetical protein